MDDGNVRLSRALLACNIIRGFVKRSSQLITQNIFTARWHAAYRYFVDFLGKALPHDYMILRLRNVKLIDQEKKYSRKLNFEKHMRVFAVEAINIKSIGQSSYEANGPSLL